MAKIFFKSFFGNNEISDLQREIIKEIKKTFGPTVNFEEFNVNQEIKEKYKIDTTPTIIIFFKEEEKERFKGLTQELFLKKAIMKISHECG